MSNPENKIKGIIINGPNCNATLIFLAAEAIAVPIDTPHKLPNSIIPMKVINFLNLFLKKT